MNKYVSTISSKGQVTIPADVRRKLGVTASDKITFVIKEDGIIEVRPTRFTLKSILGSLPAPPNLSSDMEQEIELATEEAIAKKYGPKSQ